MTNRQHMGMGIGAPPEIKTNKLKYDLESGQFYIKNAAPQRAFTNQAASTSIHKGVRDAATHPK